MKVRRMSCASLRVITLGYSILMVMPSSRGMDLVRDETRTDEAVARYGVSGSGVIVAILDRGIDWQHPDFIKPDGTTRIKWLLDMTGYNSCNPGNPPALEYSEDQINAALAGGPPIDSRDAVGHGTVTTGIAAGNGSAFAQDEYRGMAPEADLIIVKLTSEGAPAHDGQPAETAFQGCIDEALDWLDAKIEQLGQPCVALINSGTQWGPMDGTSAVSRKIDEVFGSDRPGRVYVSPSGDEGNLDNHAGGDYDNIDPTVVPFIKSGTTTTYLSLWYTGSEPAQITVAFDDGTTVGPVPPGGSLNQSGIFVIQYNPGQAFYPWQSTSGDRAVWMRIIGHSGPGSISVMGTTPGQGHFDLYSDAFEVVRFTDSLVLGRLTDYSTTLSAVVVGAHVNRTTYNDIDGILRFVGSEGGTDELWVHSSGGPTRDGRVHGVDVSAPGHNCFAAYAQESYWATFRFNLIEDGGGWYGRGGATSGSAPIVVGAVALMLELDPSLTADEVRQILRDTGAADGFTGETPNADWGFGKLDVLAALDAVAFSDPPIPADPPNDRNKNRYISFNSNNAGLPVKLKVTLTASLPHPGSVGMSWWVQAPVVPVPGQSPKPALGDGECVAILGPEVSAPEIDWDAAGCQVLHVTGCPIEPTSVYDVQAVIHANESDPLTVATILQPGAKWWGDTVGIFNGAEWTPPNGTTNIDDAVAGIKTFQGGQVVPPGPVPPGNVAHLSIPDVGPGDINMVVNINDVFLVILAFQGEMYSFGPADTDGNCP